MNTLGLMVDGPGWLSWTSMTAYVAYAFLGVVLAVVASFVVAQIFKVEEPVDHTSSHGVAH